MLRHHGGKTLKTYMTIKRYIVLAMQELHVYRRGWFLFSFSNLISVCSQSETTYSPLYKILIFDQKRKLNDRMIDAITDIAFTVYANHFIIIHVQNLELNICRTMSLHIIIKPLPLLYNVVTLYINRRSIDLWAISPSPKNIIDNTIGKIF